MFRDFPTFSRICIFCLLAFSLLIFSLLIFLFSLPLPCSAFHLSILSEVWLLNFLRLSIINYNLNLSHFIRFLFFRPIIKFVINFWKKFYIYKLLENIMYDKNYSETRILRIEFVFCGWKELWAWICWIWVKFGYWIKRTGIWANGINLDYNW